MSDQQKQNSGLWSRRLFRLVLLLVFLILILIALLHTSWFQSKAVNIVVDKVAAGLGGDVSIGATHIDLLNGIRLDNVNAIDHEGDSIIIIDQIKLNPTNTVIALLGNAITGEEISFHELSLDGINLTIKKPKGESRTNLETLFSRENTSNEESGSSNFPIIRSLRMKDLSLHYVDENTHEELHGRFEAFEVDVNNLDFSEGSTIDVDRILLLSPEFTYEPGDAPSQEESSSSPGEKASPSSQDSEMSDIIVDALQLIDGKLDILDEEREQAITGLDLSLEAVRFRGLENWKAKLSQLEGSFNDHRLAYASINEIQRTKDKVILDQAQINVNESKLLFDGDISGVEGVVSVSEAQIELEIQPSIVYPQDLIAFSQDLSAEWSNQQISEKRVQVEGKVAISSDQYDGENLVVWIDGLHHFSGNVSYVPSAIVGESELNANVERVYADMEQLSRLTDKFQFPKEINRLEEVDFKGSFDGFLENFVANGELITPLGNALLDIRFDLSGTGEEAVSYAGYLELDSFDLEKMTLDTNFGYADAKVNISNGVGPDLSQSSAEIKAVIDKLEYRDYAYRDAVFNGRLSSGVIDGDFEIHDDVLDFSFNGLVNFKESTPIFDFVVDAKRIDFCQLNLTDFPCKVAFSSDINLVGKDVKSLAGDIILQDVQLLHDTSSIGLEKIEIKSVVGEESNSFHLASDFLNFDIEGRFNLIKFAPETFHRLVGNVSGQNEVWKVDYNPALTENQDYNFTLELNDITQLASFFNVPLELTSGAVISGNQKSSLDLISIGAKIPYLSYDGHSAHDIELDIGSTDGSASAYIKMKDITSGGYMLRNLTLETVLDNQQVIWLVDYNMDEDNKGFLKGESLVSEEGYMTHVKEDEVYVNGERWKVESNGGVGIHPKFLDIENLTISDGQRYIQVSDYNNKGIAAEINDFELGLINPIIDYDKTILTGTMKSKFLIQDVFSQMVIEGDIAVDDFKVNGDDFGNLRVVAKRVDKDKNKIDLDVRIEKDTQNLYVKGYVDLDQNELESSIVIQDYPMSFFEYIIDDGISDTEGTTDIEARIYGPINDLSLSGEGVVKEGGVKIDFIGAFYRMDGQTIRISEDYIDLSGAQIQDAMDNTATIEGGLRHNFFADITADAVIASDRFIGLSTTIEDNPIYYGTGVGAIEMSFDGPFDAIDIDVTAELQNLSHLYVPLLSSSYTYDDSFIILSGDEDTVAIRDTASLVDLLKEQGVDFEMALTFTPDAKVSIIYDEVTDNVLVGSGEGSIQMRVDRAGDFTAFGNFDILEGEYLYTAYNLIAKPFVIQSGGTVTWTGDPFNATLNVTAAHSTIRAPLQNLLEEYAVIDASELSARREIDLNLILTGPLFNPDINFDIAFPNLIGDIRTYAQSKINTLKSVQNGINNQVVGLLFFNNFLPDNNGLTRISSSQVGQTGSSTITQFLTSQLSNIFSDYLTSKLGDDDFISAIDFEIGLIQSSGLVQGQDFLTGLLDVVPDEVQVNLRNYFRNENFVLNVGGNYIRETQFGGQDNFVTGDFSLDWFITEDRRLKLRFYSNFDYDYALATRRQRYGFGINFRKEFGKLTDLESVVDEIIEQANQQIVAPSSK